MSIPLTPVDVYQIVNELSKQAVGQNAPKAVDLSTFMSVGETILRTGVENTLNAISLVQCRTIFAVRPYSGRFKTSYRPSWDFDRIARKLTPLMSDCEQSQNWNTQLTPNQLADGQSIDMYKINAPKWLQFNFYGSQTLQKHITRFINQMRDAFCSPEQMAEFWSATMLEFSNEIVMANDAKTEANLIGYIAGLYQMNQTNVFDFVNEYNLENGTEYTRQELLQSYTESFFKYIAETIKILSSRLVDNTVNYHASVDGYQKILRHTPKSFQRLLMYEPLMIKLRTNVLPGVFNPDLLNIGEYESINFWQNPNDPTRIIAKPNILNTATGASTAGTEQNIPYVVGLLYDRDAFGVLPILQNTRSTPVNAAGEYWNLFVHWLFKSYVDYTENAILFVLGDGGAPTARAMSDAHVAARKKKEG